MAKSSVLGSSIAKKVAMALSGLFLISFLALHFSINLTSVFSERVFNECSDFMGYNPLIQYVMQPVLAFGVVFHFVMGFVLELKIEVQDQSAMQKITVLQIHHGHQEI